MNSCSSTLSILQSLAVRPSTDRFPARASGVGAISSLFGCLTGFPHRVSARCNPSPLFSYSCALRYRIAPLESHSYEKDRGGGGMPVEISVFVGHALSNSLCASRRTSAGFGFNSGKFMRWSLVTAEVGRGKYEPAQPSIPKRDPRLVFPLCLWVCKPSTRNKLLVLSGLAIQCRVKMRRPGEKLPARNGPSACG